MPQFRRTAMTVIVLASATPTVSAQAQIAPTDQRLPEVKVNAPEIRESAYGSVEGYRAERTGTATKTDTPIREIPSAIQIVPKQVIDDQQATRMADVIENVSSVRPGSTFGNRGDSFIVRGFQSFLSGAARQRRLSEMARRGTSGTTPTNGPCSSRRWATSRAPTWATSCFSAWRREPRKRRAIGEHLACPYRHLQPGVRRPSQDRWAHWPR